MKTNYFFKSWLVALAMGLVTNVTAEEIVVSGNTGADVQTALNQAKDGDVIVLAQPVIEVSSTIAVEKNVAIRGNGNTYFDGLESNKIFNVILPEETNGKFLLFEDLGFVAGYSDTDGGAGSILSGSVIFNRCFFEENSSTGNGGALSVTGEGTSVRFYDCEFDGNWTEGPEGTSRGGFIYTEDEVSTTFEYCKITGNNCRNGRGGAFYLNGGNHRLFYSIIHANSSGVEDEGDERGGAAFMVNGNQQALTLESCAVTGNVAYGNHGAAFFLDGDGANITLINTTVGNNLTKAGAGSWFIPSKDIDITLVNVTMFGNTGTNSGNAGGGFRIMNTGNRVNFFNSIIVGNVTDNEEGAVDIGVNGEVNNILADFVFKNSIIGLIGGIAPSAVPAPQDNPNIANKSKINMYNLLGEDAQPEWVSMDESGIDIPNAYLQAPGFGMRYYPLKADGYATALGDSELLFDYDTDEDMFLSPRTVAADGSIYAGAVQAVTGGDRAPAVEIPAWDPWNTTGINNVYGSAQDIKINSVVSKGGLLTVDFGDLKGKATGKLVSLNGQVVETVFNLPVVGKGVYAINAEPGVYILNVSIEGKTFAKKLIVK